MDYQLSIKTIVTIFKPIRSTQNIKTQTYNTLRNADPFK